MVSVPRFALAMALCLLRLVGQTDSKICATCHQEIAKDYARTGMARSFFISKESEVGEYYHALSDSHYAMIVRNGQSYQRRWQLDAGGKQINVEDVKVDYVMGSGNRARSYLHRTERGMLIELPLGWYPDHGGEWRMVPGSDTTHPQTRRFVSYKCMLCHNAYPNIPEANQKPGSDPVFLGELPEGIDCQRCHGPGAEHARTAGRASIVNPAKLSLERRMEVCMQCHLETTSGRIPAMLQRFDRGAFSYVAGQPLVDFAISFDHAPGTGHEGKFEAVSSVYRLRQSRCFLESAGKLECRTCHDPHRIPRGEEAVREYSKVCTGCHPSVHTSVSMGNCITCHMPKRRVDDAPHVIMTDHLIQRRAPADALAEFAERPAEEYHGEVVPYYPAPLPKTSMNDLYRAVAQVGLGNNVQGGLPDLARLIDELKPREMEFYMVLGYGWKLAGKPAEAAAAYRRALEIEPGSTRAMRGLAEVLSREEAAQVLARAVEIAPKDPESWFRLGVLTPSAEKIRKAIALDPWLPDQSRRLAEITRSEAALKDALRTDPFDDAAWNLGGRIFTEQGNFEKAFFDFERAIKLRPSGSYMYDYALALIRAEQFDKAQSVVEMAVRADPSLVEAHELLGGLYMRKKELAAAVREYEAVLAVKPDLARVQLRLGMVLAAEGDKEGAAEHFREAMKSDDAAIARQAEQALRELK